MNKKKKITIVAIGIFALTMITVGSSFAFYNYSKISNNVTVITSGNLQFSYFERENNLSISNQFPVEDRIGASDNNNVYEFQVGMLSDNHAQNMYYDVIAVTNNVGNKTFANDQIKFALTKEDTYVAGTSATTGRKLSELDGLRKDVSYGQGLLLSNQLINSGETHNYELRTWISDDVNYTNTTDEDGMMEGKYNDFTYSLKVKINASQTQREDLIVDNEDTDKVWARNINFFDKNDNWVYNRYTVFYSEPTIYELTDGYSFVLFEKGEHEAYLMGDVNPKGMSKEEIINNSIASATFTTDDDTVKFSNGYKMNISFVNKVENNIGRLENYSPFKVVDGEFGINRVSYYDSERLQEDIENTPNRPMEDEYYDPNYEYEYTDWDAYCNKQNEYLELYNYYWGLNDNDTANEYLELYNSLDVNDYTEIRYGGIDYDRYYSDYGKWTTENALVSQNYAYSNIDEMLEEFNNAFTGDLIIPETFNGEEVISIAEAFLPYENSLTSITLPKTLKKISQFAFNALPNIPINIPSCEEIGYSAFANAKITNINLPDNLKTIEGFAFANSNIKEINISNNIKNLGDDIFRDSLLEKLIIDTDIPNYFIRNVKTLKEVILGENVTSIGDRAFSECYNLKSVNIPDSVKAIGYESFLGVGNIVYHGSIEDDYTSSWGAYALNGYVDGDFIYRDSSKKELLRHANSDITYIIIPDEVESIGPSAFVSHLYSTVEIPDSVTTIDSYAFIEVPNIIYHGSVTDYNGNNWGAVALNGYREGDFLYKDSSKNELLRYFGKDKNIIIPNGVVIIGPLAIWFENEWNTDIKSVEIPNTVTTIGDRAFYQMEGIKDLIVPDSVTSIGWEAFWGIQHITYNGSAEDVDGNNWGANSRN